jgi:hypothetical protein
MQYLNSMRELKLDLFESTEEEEVEVDAITAAAIERGIEAADEDHVHSIDEVRTLIPQWISRFSTPTLR